TAPQNPMRSDTTTHRHHVRPVLWLITKPVALPGDRFFIQATLGRLDANKADQIRQAYLAAYPDDLEIQGAIGQLFGNDADDEEGFIEGRETFALHRRKERNRKAVRLKKEQVLEAHGRLLCEVCD